MHRNLNPNDIWLSKFNNKIHLLNLGTCTHICRTRNKIETVLICTSPEMAKFKEYYDKRTDIWSIGIIF